MERCLPFCRSGNHGPGRPPRFQRGALECLVHRHTGRLSFPPRTRAVSFTLAKFGRSLGCHFRSGNDCGPGSRSRHFCKGLPSRTPKRLLIRCATHSIMPSYLRRGLSAVGIVDAGSSRGCARDGRLNRPYHPCRPRASRGRSRARVPRDRSSERRLEADGMFRFPGLVEAPSDRVR